MVDAFRYDPTSFGDSIEESNRTLDTCMRFLSDKLGSLGHDKDRYRRIYYVHIIIYNQYKSWLDLYKIERPNKAVDTTAVSAPR